MDGPKILHCITGTAIGGAEIMLLRYLISLGEARRRHSVVSMMPPGPVADQIAALGVPVETLGVGGAAQMPRGVWRLRQILESARPDVVHGWMYHGSLMATLALKLGRHSDVGLLWAIHHSLADPAREKAMTRAVLALLRSLADRADVITYCSEIARGQHRKYGLPAARDQMIANAIDPHEFAPDPEAAARLRALTGAPPERLLIGNIGRAHPMKDHAAFARVIAALVSRGMDVQGIVIGADQPDGPAVAAAAEEGISERLTALPARNDIAALVPGLDLYLLSSAWGEALPLAVAEAMAAGVPAVVTDVGDCRWLVDEGCGALAPPRDIAAMADAAQGILSLPAQPRQALGQRCRERIIRLMSPEPYISAHDTAYRATLQRREAIVPWQRRSAA